MNLRVSLIRNRPLRRLAIVVTYLPFALFAVPMAAWNGLMDFIGFQIQIARSAKEQWK